MNRPSYPSLRIIGRYAGSLFLIAILSGILGAFQASAAEVDQAVRQSVVESLTEAKRIESDEIKAVVYDAWAVELAKLNVKRIEDLPATQAPGTPALKNKTRADHLGSVSRIAVAFADDLEQAFSAFDVNKDLVVAMALCQGLERKVPWQLKNRLTSQTAEEIATWTDLIFWMTAEREGLLEGGKPQPPAHGFTPMVMTEPRVEVDPVIRAGVVKALPEAEMLKNEELRERVYDAWAFALSKSKSFKRIEDIRGSGSPTMARLKDGSQANHLRGTARISLAVVREMAEHYQGFKVTEEEVIAGGLLHDVGKPFEFDPEYREYWIANSRKTGFPPMRHSVWGGYVALTAGLPPEMAHLVAAHSREGQFIDRTTATIIVHEVDLAYWDVTDIAGLLIDD